MAGCCLYNENEIDVIIPVHNAAATIRETVESAMHQEWTTTTTSSTHVPQPVLYVCCYNDGSTDDSWSILKELKTKYDQRQQRVNNESSSSSTLLLESHLIIDSSPPHTPPRGAGAARNRAAALRKGATLCWLDSDDIMHPSRIQCQFSYLHTTTTPVADTVLLGTNFDRIPRTATTHYTHWANTTMAGERLYLEQFREVTLIQPTWMMRRSRFEHVLHGYLEAPRAAAMPVARIDTDSHEEEPFNVTRWVQDQQSSIIKDDDDDDDNADKWRLVHPLLDTPQTLRWAEDMRFFLEHLHRGGKLAKVASNGPLVSYRHTAGSQSSLTPRKLLLALRTVAFEKMVLQSAWHDTFIVWGAGRDGKDFIKALSPEARQRVYCICDVDDTKIARGYYTTPQWKIPIVHFTALIPGDATLYNQWKKSQGTTTVGSFHRMDKHRATPQDHVSKRPKVDSSVEKQDPGMKEVEPSLLQTLPVVVCVAMYRTNGALEANVSLIERQEGVTLWHFN